MATDITNATDVAVAQGGLGKTVSAAVANFHRAAVTPSLINMVAAPKGSNVVQFNVYGKVATSSVVTETNGTEGTEVNATALTTSAISATVLRNHLNIRVTDLAQHANPDNLVVNAGAVAGNTIAAHFDGDVCTLFGSFSTEVGGVASSMTLGVLFDAVSELEAEDAPRPYNCVLHPLQVYGSMGLSTELGNIQVNQSAGALNQGQGVAEELRANGLVTRLGGVNVYVSAQVIGTSDDHHGGMFARSGIGCGFVPKNGGSFIEIATERNEIGAMTHVVCNSYYEVKELIDAHCVEVKTHSS